MSRADELRNELASARFAVEQDAEMYAAAPPQGEFRSRYAAEEDAS